MNILDNLGKKLADTYKVTVNATGEILEETKTRLSLLSEQNKLEELYQKLGEKVFSLYDNGQKVGVELENECLEIKAQKETISTMKTKINELRNIKICHECGSEIELDHAFCPKCGKEQASTPPPVVDISKE